MFLTQSGGFIVKPISKLLGAILSLIFDGLNMLGSVNMGIAIILFTLIIRLILLPMMIQQNKSTKIMNYVQPEINKVTKKYRGKKDQESMLAQQRETKAIQDKYGISLSSGCLTSLIQLPVFFALYRVIQNIPAYVGKVKVLYQPIADAIVNDENARQLLTQFKEGTIEGVQSPQVIKQVALDFNNTNTVIDVLAKFPAEAWDTFKGLFSNTDQVVTAINQNVDEINHMYDFFGINLTTVPGWALTTALIIPILSFVFQFLSMKVTPQQKSDDPAQQATMRSMKMMMNVMPLFSFFICLNVPVGLGLYWAAGSFISFLTTIFINVYFKHCDMEKIIEKSKKKAAKKMAKRKAKGKVSFWDKVQESMTGQAASAAESASNNNPKVNSQAATTSLKNYSSSTMNVNNGNTRYRAGSLAAKANVMQRYNDNNNGGKN